MSYFSPPPGSQARCANFIQTGGWMGWSGNFFFLAHISKTTRYFFQTGSYTFKMCFKIFFAKNSKNLKKIRFFKNFRQNRGLVFFRFFEHKFANFSKTTWYFFLIVFGPLRRLFKTSSAKNSKKKTIFKFFKKFRTSQFSAIFGHFSILKGIPYKKIKGISFLKFKGISFDRQKYLEFLFILTDFGGFDFSNTDFQI